MPFVHCGCHNLNLAINDAVNSVTESEKFSVATAERSFSKLKLIKAYLRSKLSQERLDGLAILSIENAEAKDMDKQKRIKNFASVNAGRQKLEKNQNLKLNWHGASSSRALFLIISLYVGNVHRPEKRSVN